MDYQNPIIIELLRGERVESVQRGAWVLVDSAGSVLDHVGKADQKVFGRSATKSLQTLAMVESGAIERFGLGLDTVALACASHNGEEVHTRCAAESLKKIGLSQDNLLCGPQAMRGSARETEGSRLGNNCSGKHASFLALSQFIDADPAEYLDVDGAVQTRVIEAVKEICDLDDDDFYLAVDGCSAPTFELPLHKLAIGIARIANPKSLAPERAKACELITDAAKAHPELVAGTYERICTRIIEASKGKLFAKIGAEAVYVVGAVGLDRAIALKVDDGGSRNLGPLVVALLEHYEMIDSQTVEALADISDLSRKNWDGIEIGSLRFPLL